MTENKRFEVEFDYEYDEILLRDIRTGELLHIIDCCIRLNAYENENEQLQARNDRQAKQLDNLYRLIEEKDWRALTDIMGDFKECEEQLQREWMCYE